MNIFHRVTENVRRLLRQVQAVVETDFFASSLKNDEAVLAALETLVRAREMDQARIEALEAEVRELRNEILGEAGSPASEDGK